MTTNNIILLSIVWVLIMGYLAVKFTVTKMVINALIGG